MPVVRRASFVFPLLACAVGLLTPAAASAQKPTSKSTEYSPYEREAIDAALAERGLTVDPAPEGKSIRRIEVVRLQVLEGRDPGPELLRPVPLLSPIGKHVTKPMLNWLHVLSKEYIIRRELLLGE